MKFSPDITFAAVRKPPYGFRNQIQQAIESVFPRTRFIIEESTDEILEKHYDLFNIAASSSQRVLLVAEAMANIVGKDKNSITSLLTLEHEIRMRTNGIHCRIHHVIVADEKHAWAHNGGRQDEAGLQKLKAAANKKKLPLVTGTKNNIQSQLEKWLSELPDQKSVSEKLAELE
jgi:hypothetical protein